MYTSTNLVTLLPSSLLRGRRTAILGFTIDEILNYLSSDIDEHE